MGLRRFHSPQAFFFAVATRRKLHSSNSLGENPLPLPGGIVQRGIRARSSHVQLELSPDSQQPHRRRAHRQVHSRGPKSVSPLSAHLPILSPLPPITPTPKPP